MNLCASLARNGKTSESAYPSEQRLKSMGGRGGRGGEIRGGDRVALRTGHAFAPTAFSNETTPSGLHRALGVADRGYRFSGAAVSERFSFFVNWVTRSPSRRALSSSPSPTPGSSGPVIAAAPTSPHTLPVFSFR